MASSAHPASDGTPGEATATSGTENNTPSTSNPITNPNPKLNPKSSPSIDPSPIPSPCPSPKPADPSPNMDSVDSVPVSGNAEGDGSGMASRVAWKKPSGTGSGGVSSSRRGFVNSNGSLVMGADSWPALSSVRNGKAADSPSESGSNPPPNKRIEPPVAEASVAAVPPPHAERGRSGHSQREPGHSSNNAWVSNNNSRRNNPNPNHNHNHNPNPNLNYVRVNQGWQTPTRGYHGGWDNGAGVGFRQTRVGPRNLPHVGGPVFVGHNAGFINAGNFPNGPGGLYYIPVAPPPPPPPLYPIHDLPFFPHPVPPPPGVILPGPDQGNIRAALAKQIEYYFCVENLCKDIFLRSNMDNDGFVPVSVISRFNRVQNLTQDPTLIVDALQNSELVEVQDNKLRKRRDWANWLLPPNQFPATRMVSTTTPSLQDEGSQQTNSTSSSIVDDRLSSQMDSAEQEGSSSSDTGNREDPCLTLTTGDEELGVHQTTTNSNSNSISAGLEGSVKDLTKSDPGCY